MNRFIAVLLGFCLSGAASAAPIRVATSVPPLGALVRLVGGDRVEVQVLMPPGASPHGYEPGPDAIRSLSKAEILFVVGRNLDGWAENLARGANPKIQIERLGYNLPPPEPEADPGDPEGDPHVWLDPIKAITICQRIAGDLAALRPDEADSIKAAIPRVVRRLYALDVESREALAPVKEVPFAALHGGLNHFVARYHLTQIAVIEIFPGREPSPKYLKQVVTSIRNVQAKVVFAEPQLSAQLAEVVASEAGVPVAEVDAIGGVPGKMTYEELIRSLTTSILHALEGPK